MDEPRDVLGNGPIMLVLVGLIGSGKSTFAQALEKEVPHFRRCNQDDLGDRLSVERLARQTLQEGRSAVVDRTNFDEAQRVHWGRIAREVPGTKIWCIVFDTPYDVCRERLQHRVGHPTIHSADQAMEVLEYSRRMLIQPSGDEGFERIFRLDLGFQSLEYTVSNLQSILSQVASSLVLVQQRHNHEFFRPQGSRGGRGFGRRGHRGRRAHGFDGGRNNYGHSFHTIAPRDADADGSWRRHGEGGDVRGRGLQVAPLTHSNTRVVRGGAVNSSYANDSNMSFRGGGRAFGGRVLSQSACVTAKYEVDRSVGADSSSVVMEQS